MKLMSLSTVACGTCFLAAANITPGELAFLLDRSSMYVCSVGITDLISGHSQTLSQYICNMLFYDNVTKAFKCNKISTIIIIIIIMIIIIISVISHTEMCACVCERALSAQSHLMHHWHSSHHIHPGSVPLWTQTNILSVQTGLKVRVGCTDRYRCLWVL